MHKDEILEYNFIKSILVGIREINADEIRARINHFGIESFSKCFQVVEIYSNYVGIEYEKKDNAIALTEQIVKEELNKSKYDYFVITNEYNNVQVLFYNINRNNRIIETLRKIRNRIINELKLENYVAIGSIVDSPIDISRSAIDARSMLSYKYQYEDSGIVDFNSMDIYETNVETRFDIEIERIIGCFYDGNLEKMEDRLYQLVEAVRKTKNYSDKHLKLVLAELIFRILNTASLSHVNVEDVIDDRDIYKWILSQKELSIVIEWVLEVSSKLLLLIKDNKKNISNDDFKEIVTSFIRSNIRDINLSLDKIADKFNLSSSYLSYLFKKELGIGINEFINRERVSLSKKLLINTDFNCKEIASQIGYANNNYFIRVFSKYEGETPSNYRKKHKIL